jgi:hypothetical protein
MDRTKESIKNLSSALSIYEKLLHKKYDRTSRDEMEPYDIRMSSSNIECEVRFNRINKEGFENVYKRLLSYGFTKTNESYQLKIMHYMDKSSSKIRCELDDLTHIKEFCTSNTLPEKTNYVLKDRFPEYMNYYENRDFNFRLSIQKEHTLDVNDPTVSDINLNWNSFEKSFRYMNRIELTHPDIRGVRVDMSIVKSLADDDGKLFKEKQFSSSRLFDQPEAYEIEIELYDTDYIIKNMGLVTKSIQKVIKYVSCGLQNSDYPIPYRQQRQVLNEYNNYIHKNESELKYVNNKLFIGPSSYTLQIQNITHDPDNSAPNILNDFCVTDKADGERRLCIITKSGQIYFIDMNMRVQYTGVYTNETSVLGSIIDGELIHKDKTGKTLNVFAAFDLYFQETKNYRVEPFYKANEPSRYRRLIKFMKSLNGSLKYESDIDKITFEAKSFNMSSADKSIMGCCGDLLGKIKAGSFRYNTDGLIFTSMSLGVGMEGPGDPVPDVKYTWKHSFKWKPPEFNTIDFLIEVKKEKGKDDIVYISSDKNNNIDSYKILHLYVGHDTRQGLINTQQMLFNDELPVVSNEKKSNDYKKVLFVPSSPYEPQAYIAYIPLIRDSSGSLKMFTEEGDIIEDDTIIEFKYVMKDDMRFNWEPLRIRHDKTAEYKTTGRNFGNNYATANSNWNSIHNPVTEEMLMDEKLNVEVGPDDDVYYNRGAMTGKSLTTELRNFHNWHVKGLLCASAIQRGFTVIDYACGQGGDINKWEKSRPKFVLGIDIARDNIHNPISGICARYLNMKARKRNLFHGLFVRGNTSKLIMREEFAETTDKNERDEEVSKFVIQQIFATKPKSDQFGKYIPTLYGIAKNKFDVGSIQFAIHYMFENVERLHSFMKNVSDTIKVGGHFIGTCFDGELVFNKLKTKETNETYYIHKPIDVNSKNKDDVQQRKKIWSVKKKYNKTEFPNDESCLGMMISVFQETINKEFDEYLVNFNYFIECMNQYGFEPEKKLPGTDLPGIANFKVIYDHISKGEKLNMSEEEMEISFLNKYFIFKKTRNIINTDGIYRAFVEGIQDDTVLNHIGRPVKLNKMIILK